MNTLNSFSGCKTVIFALFTVIFFSASSGCALFRSDGYENERNYYDDNDAGDAATAGPESFGQPKKKILVLGFVNDTPLGGEKLGEFARELSRLLNVSGKAVIPEAKLPFSSKDFYIGDKIKLGVLAREGKKQGVSLIAVGKIKRITYRKKGDDVGLFRKQNSVALLNLEMRLYDISVPKELLFDEKPAESTSSQIQVFEPEYDKDSSYDDAQSERRELVQNAIENGMKVFAVDILKVIDRLGWHGRVVKVTPTRIYINAGRASGLNVGDILKVVTQGEDIFDPITGAYMGKTKGQVKGTLEVVDYLGTDGAVTMVHSGGNFGENDFVQLY